MGQFARGALKQCLGAVFFVAIAVAEMTESGLHALGQPTGTGKAAMFVVELRRLIVPDVQSLQFPDLVLQQFESRRAIGMQLAEPVDFLAQLQPGAKTLANFRQALLVAAEMIEDMPLDQRPDQRLMLMLTMNICEVVAKLPESRKRYRPAVNKTTVAPGAGQYAPDHALAVVIQRVRFQPR